MKKLNSDVSEVRLEVTIKEILFDEWEMGYQVRLTTFLTPTFLIKLFSLLLLFQILFHMAQKHPSLL